MNYKDVPIVPSGMIAMMQNMDDELGGRQKDLASLLNFLRK